MGKSREKIKAKAKKKSGATKAIRRALFLDRDGTINFDRVYINHPDLIELIPKAGAAIAKARAAGFLIIVVTNQSGIGRKLIDAKQMPKIHARLDELLKVEADTRVDAYKICPHHPDEACSCRKPGTKLIEQAVKKFKIDVKKSFFVGDTISDVQAGQRVGCATILVRSGKGKESEHKFRTKKDLRAAPPNYIADDLAGAVEWVLRRES